MPVPPPPALEETDEIGSALARMIREILERSGLGGTLLESLTWVFLCALILILAVLAYLVARMVITRSIRFLIGKSATRWDDMLVEQAQWLPQYGRAIEAAKKRLAAGKRIPTRDDYRGAARLTVRGVDELRKTSAEKTMRAEDSAFKTIS